MFSTEARLQLYLQRDVVKFRSWVLLDFMFTVLTDWCVCVFFFPLLFQEITLIISDWCLLKGRGSVQHHDRSGERVLHPDQCSERLGASVRSQP